MREMVALTGFMGTGKTTVGQALARLLGWSFFDLDCEIERRQKLAVREIFRLYGEAAFREIETATMRSVLQQATDPAVLALGGGTFVEPENASYCKAMELASCSWKLRWSNFCNAVRCRTSNLRKTLDRSPLRPQLFALSTLSAFRSTVRPI